MFKKISVMAVLIFILATSTSFAVFETRSTSSGEQTSDGQVFTGNCAVASVMVITDGTNAATVTVHDGTSNSAKKVAELKCDGSDYYCGWIWEFPVSMDTGIYVDVTGTGASYIVEYIY